MKHISPEFLLGVAGVGFGLLTAIPAITQMAELNSERPLFHQDYSVDISTEKVGPFMSTRLIKTRDITRQKFSPSNNPGYYRQLDDTPYPPLLTLAQTIKR